MELAGEALADSTRALRVLETSAAARAPSTCSSSQRSFVAWKVARAALRRTERLAWAFEALVTKAREASHVRRIVAHTPLERPQSGRVLEKAGFAMVREMDDADEAGNIVRVKEWELAVSLRGAP